MEQLEASVTRMSKEEMARVDTGEEAIHQIMQDFTGHRQCVTVILTVRGDGWRVISKELMWL